MMNKSTNVNPDNMPNQKSEGQQPKLPLLQRTWNWLTAPSGQLTEIGEQRSARLAASFLFAIAALDLIGGLARAPRTGLLEAFSGPIGYSFIALLLTYLLSRTKWYRAAIFLFSFSFSSLAYVSIIQSGGSATGFGTFVLIYVPLSLIVASSFISAPAVFLLTGLNVGAYMLVQSFGVTLPENIGAQAGIVTVIGVVLMLLVSFRNNTEKIRLEELQATNRELESLSTELEQRVEARTQELVSANRQATHRFEQLTAIADIARSTTNVQDLESLLLTITDFISQRLGYYHVGIFLNDANNTYTILRAANSAGGQNMLARRHRLRIGQEGIVGYAVSRGQPRIALDVGVDAVYFDNPDLPDTHSEMAIPLRVGAETIGALDIQSTEPNAFSTEDLPVFTTLADQVTVAIQNARLLNQTQNALREAEEAYAEQAGQAWKGFTQSQLVQGYHFDGIESKPVTKDNKLKANPQAGLTFPMRLRGKTIGNLKLETSNKDRLWSEEEITLIESAIERAALALENARLLEDAQRRASREQAIGEISSKISSSTNIDAILRATVNALGHQIGGTEVSFELKTDSEKTLDQK